MRTLSSVAALALAIGLTVPASAEAPTPWPRDVDITVRHGSEYVPPKARTVAKPVNAWTDPFATYDAWKALPATFDNSVQTNPPAKELDAKVRSYREYWRARNAELIDRNGDLAPVLPVRVHEKLNAQAFGDPFGTPVMGGKN